MRLIVSSCVDVGVHLSFDEASEWRKLKKSEGQNTYRECSLLTLYVVYVQLGLLW